jgi:HEPN domain-containing protein
MDRREAACQWQAKADSDLAAAETLWHAGSASRDVICFHCQQAGEKMLKALLVASEIPFPRTHDLVALAQLLAARFPALNDWLPSLAEFSRYAVEVRYPEAFYLPSTEETDRALQAAQRLCALCRSLLV